MFLVEFACIIIKQDIALIVTLSHGIIRSFRKLYVQNMDSMLELVLLGLYAS